MSGSLGSREARLIGVSGRNRLVRVVQAFESSETRTEDDGGGSILAVDHLRCGNPTV